MRTLILSDLHGNQAALLSVLNHAYDRFRPTEVWCLGDTVGYGPDPYLVWHTLRHEPIPVGGWLAGNHDWGLIEKLKMASLFSTNEFADVFKLQNFRDKAAQVLLDHLDRLTDNQELMEHLDLLPVMSRLQPGIYLTHGAFMSDVERAVTHYLVTARMLAPELSPEKMAANFQKAAEIFKTDVHTIHPVDISESPRLFAFGHNHIPGLWRWQENHWQPLNHQEPQRLGDLHKAPICINPGSVGFPRNGLGCPSYALIDWEGDNQVEPFITIQYVTYDVNLVRDKMQAAPYKNLLDEPGFLSDPRC
jgi:predicted phosphodiesterase